MQKPQEIYLYRLLLALDRYAQMYLHTYICSIFLHLYKYKYSCLVWYLSNAFIEDFFQPIITHIELLIHCMYIPSSYPSVNCHFLQLQRSFFNIYTFCGLGKTCYLFCSCCDYLCYILYVIQ